jgi:hypothetical protein
MVDHDEGALTAARPQAPPPRAVPFRLRCQLLAGGATVWGSVVFGLASALSVGLVCGLDPVGSLRLALHRHEAPGRVLWEDDTSYEENDSTVRRHDYEFRLPDGALVRGHSYSDGHRYLGFAPAPGAPDPGRWARVTVEYDPGHPATSRIKGTRTHSVSYGVGLMLLAVLLVVLAGALLAVVVGVAVGRMHIRLLRDGRLAEATVTGCAPPANADSPPPDVPVAECRRRLAEQAARAARSPFVLLWNGANSAWCLAVLVMTVGGAAFAVFGMVKVGLGDESFWINGQPARGAEGLVWLAGFLVVWIVAGGVMLAGGRLLRLTPRNTTPAVSCAYEFRPPGGEAVHAREEVPAAALAEAEAPLPVLYNPQWAQEALLLAALSPPVRLSARGRWEATVSLWPLLRLAAAVLALVGGPLLALGLAVSGD